MSRLWRASALVAASALLACAAALAPIPASASTGYLYIQEVGGPPNNIGLLSVDMVSDMPITSLTVDLLSDTNGTTLLSWSMSAFTVPTDDGDGVVGSWTLISPITTAQLPLGTYPISVTAASADASNSYTGYYFFGNVVSFPTFSSSGTSFSYDDQDVTFSGTAVIQAPGGTPTPFGNEPIVLADDSRDGTALTTASDGSFSVTVPAAQEVPSTSQYFWVQYTAGYGPDIEAELSSKIFINVTTFPVTMTAALTTPHAKAGQSVRVTGTLTYSDKGVSTPLAGNAVTLYRGAIKKWDAVAATVSGTNGQFSMSVPNLGRDITWYVMSKPSGYLSAATVKLPMTVAQPSFIGNFHARLSAYAVVRITGCIVRPSRVANVEYAARAHGPWKVLGRWHAQRRRFSACSYQGRPGTEYVGSYYAPLASGYYRVVNVGTYQIQTAVSSAVHLARLFTKITSFSVSPHRVSKGGRFSVSGRLWKQNSHGTWHPYAERRVLVIFRYRGTLYAYRHEPKTDGAGRFSGTFPVYGSALVFAQYDGDASHFASATKRIRVTETGARSGVRPAGAIMLGEAAVPIAAHLAALLLAVASRSTSG